MAPTRRWSNRRRTGSSRAARLLRHAVHACAIIARLAKVECAIEGTLHAPSEVAVFAPHEVVRAHKGTFFAHAGVASCAAMHEPARVAHAVVARRRKTVSAGNHKRPARVGAVLALGDMAAVAGGHVGFAVLAPEPLARVAGQQVLRIL